MKIFHIAPDNRRIFIKSDKIPELQNLVSKENHYICPNNEFNINVLTISGHKRVNDIYFPIDNFHALLRNYQKENLEFINSHDGNCIISDDMGLGKTISSIAYLAINKELRPALVVCPASLKNNWENELNKFLSGSSVTILTGQTPYTFIYDYPSGIYIINYDIIQYWEKELIDLHPRIIICDEIHKIANTGTRKKPVKRTKSLKNIGKKIPNKIGLSGTLIKSKPREIYNPVEFISPGLFGKKREYDEKYCAGVEKPWGWDNSGSSNISELHNVLKSIMIRHTKEEVLTELPPITKSVLPVDISNYNEYLKAETDFIQWLRVSRGPRAAKKASKAESINKQTHLLSLAGLGKINHATDFINNFLPSGDKILVFTTHKKVIDVLYEKYKDTSVKIDGSVPTNKRQMLADKFQNDDTVKILFGNLIACAEGLNLTKAVCVLFIEYSTIPGINEQAWSRCHRMKQRYSVNVYFLVGKNTIDELVIRHIDINTEIVKGILDGKEGKDVEKMIEFEKYYLKKGVK